MLTIAGYYAGVQFSGKAIMDGNNNNLTPQENNDDELLKLVEEALLKRATGYEDASGKAVPPDLRAAMYWLENRCPERWKKSRSPEKEDAAEKSLSYEETAL